MKRKNNGMYLLNTDIEKLNKRYSVLYKEVKNDTNLSEAQRDRECEVLLAKYNFEVEELNAFREVEYATQQAKIEARNLEEKPWRRNWLWRLLLAPVTNRPQDIIEEEAACNAEEHFAHMEKELIIRAVKRYNLDMQKLSQRERKKVLKKYFTNKHLLEVALQIYDKTYTAGSSEQLSQQSETDQATTPATSDQNGHNKAEGDHASAPGSSEQPGQGQPKADQVTTPATSDQNGHNKAEGDPASAPGSSEQSDQGQPKADQAANPNARRNRKKRPQANADSAPTQLPLDEVPTDDGAQIRLRIP